MSRRNKPRVVWLPPTNANSLGADERNGYQAFTVDVTGLIGEFAVAEIPLTIDAQSDPLDPNTSLADVESAGYRLRRIVGKIFCIQLQQAITNGPSVLVTAGIIVRRVDPESGTSLASLDTTGDTQGPGRLTNYSDPWVWRRSWILGNNLATDSVQELPESNMEYGSVADGPHVDQKTARVVSAEERLFLNVSSTLLQNGGELTTSTFVTTDLRILASMRTQSGNRRNASR